MANVLENTVILCGSGRSGTTLLAKLIDASESVLYRHEPDRLRPAAVLPFLPEPPQYSACADDAIKYLFELVSERTGIVSTKPPLFRKRFRTRQKHWMRTCCAQVSRVFSLAGIDIRVPDLTNSSDLKYLIKTVSSLGRVPMFACAAPETKFIHIVRHPGAVQASLAKGVEENLMADEVFLKSAFRMEIAKKFLGLREEIEMSCVTMQRIFFWMCENEKVFTEMKEADNYLLVSYEDLCTNMRAVMIRVCEFIGIEFDAQMRTFINLIERERPTAGYFSILKNPVSRIAAWEKKLSHSEIKKIDDLILQSEIGEFVSAKYTTARENASSLKETHDNF